MPLEGSLAVGIETDGTLYAAIASLFRVLSFADSARNLSASESRCRTSHGMKKRIAATTSTTIAATSCRCFCFHYPHEHDDDDDDDDGDDDDDDS